MKLAKAKEILGNVEWYKEKRIHVWQRTVWTFGKFELLNEWHKWHHGTNIINLNGDFNIEELEAIATYMKEAKA